MEPHYVCSRCKHGMVVNFTKKQPTTQPNNQNDSSNDEKILQDVINQQCLQYLDKMFEWATEKSNVDHPLCLECKERIFSKFSKELQVCVNLCVLI